MKVLHITANYPTKDHPVFGIFVKEQVESQINEGVECRVFFSNGKEKGGMSEHKASIKKVRQLLKNATVLALDRPDNLQAKYGFPTKLGEYLLTANPVVVTSVGDIPLFLKDKYNALLANPDEPENFAENLEWMINHPSEAEEIGKRGAETAALYFDSNNEAKKMLHYIFQ